jgi:hypothetical protein
MSRFVGGKAELAGAVRARSTLVKQTFGRRFDPVGHELIYQASYLDLARRTPWLKDVPLASPGGGTASFSQLYLLLRILTEARGIQRVLELGAGISTSLIAQWVASREGVSSVHVDDDEQWLAMTVPENPRITPVFAPLKTMNVAGHAIQWYDTPAPAGPFDLVLIDGPQAWNAENRFHRLGVLTWLPENLNDEFIVLVDDSSRPGEHLLVGELETVVISSRDVPVHRRHVVGANSQTLLVTDAHRFAAYL